jgi:BioD-like phosphotransacetylase family protein
VARIDDDYALDRLLLVNSFIRDSGLDLVGTVLNNIPKQLLDKVKGVCAPLMEERGFRVLGSIPARTELTAPTVQELWDILGGELLVGHEELSRPVEDVVIGAMTQESALSYFRRSVNKAVITGGDRSDVALAALATSTSVLILTGGLYPDVKVLACASEKGVPVLLVPGDTYATIERLHLVARKFKANDVQGITAAKESLERYCDYQTIWESTRP